MKTCKQCLSELDDSYFNIVELICSKCLNENRKKTYFSICKKCNKTLSRMHFKKSSRYCLECSEIRENEISKAPAKKCKNCGKEKHMPDEIYYGSFNCRECEKELEEQKKNKIWKHPCKDCGREFEVPAMKTWFICDDCQKKRQERLEERLSKHICKNCGKEFSKTRESHQIVCNDCKEQQKIYISTCMTCGEQKTREFFTLRKFICDDCSEIINAEEYFDRTYRKCNSCNDFFEIGKEIKNKSFFCKECIRIRRKERANAAKKKSWVRICMDCGAKTITIVSRATKIYCEKCKQVRTDLRRDKIERYMNQKKNDYCQICKKYTENGVKNRTIVCPSCRSEMEKFRMSCFRDGKYIKVCISCNHEFEASAERFWQNIRCDDCSQHAEDLERGYHFGYKGVCTDGHKFSSLHEQDFDEWLNEKRIKHIPQCRLAPTNRRSDFYLEDYKLHIEIDGMDRKDDVDWYGKLSVYEKLGMKQGKDYLILKPVLSHYKNDKSACFEQIDSLVLPLLTGVI